MNKNTIALLLACGVLSMSAQAQQKNENADRIAAGQAPIYRVTVTERTAKAISYRQRSGATKIDFRGTALMPAAHGEAKVESKQGYIEVEVEFRNLPEASKFGNEYLTYVLWAITPEGRTSNLGEVLRNGTSAKLDVTTELQVFGLVVTAEPYFAVSRPSNVIVMENAVRPDTLGKIELIDAKYELFERGQYQHLANVQGLKMDPKIPIEVYEARNAIQIARSSGADRFATETFDKAEASLKQSDGYRVRKAGLKPVAMTARQAVQTAEDARAIAVKRQDEALLASERQASADREARAENGRVAAESEADRVTRMAAEAKRNAQIETDRLKSINDSQAANAQAVANGLRQENATQAANAQNEANRLRASNEAQAANAQTEAARMQRENEEKLAAAQNETARLKSVSDMNVVAAQTEAARLKAINDAKLASVQSDADRVTRESNARTAAAQNETARLKSENDARIVAAQTEAARLKSINDAKLASVQSEADRVARESNARTAAAQNETNRLRAENDAQKATAQAAMERIAAEKQQLEKDKTELRAALLTQFNVILQTRDTARGLIVNMSDVIFSSGKFTLLPGAREKLSKVAGIIASHPGLSLAIEGHTDNVGSDARNQTLSEERGGAVRDYLVKQGMAKNSVSSKGFGEGQPVATNDTAAGRQQNRRVEIVISGDIIGKQEGVPVASR